MNGRHALRIWPVLLVGLAVAVPPPATAALPKEALEIVRRIPVQDHGRVKPFDSYAKEVLQRITGSFRYQKEDPVATVLSLLADPSPWQARPMISVPFLPLREALGMGRHDTRAAYNDLVASRTLMRMLPPIAEKQQRDDKLTMLEQETMDAFDRFVSFSQLTEQQVNLVPPVSALDHIWLPIVPPEGHPDERPASVREAWTALLQAVQAGQAEAMAPAARRLADALRAVNPAAYPAPWRLDLEVFYNTSNPFQAARILYWIAALALLAQLVRPKAWRTAKIGTAALWVGVIVHGAGIALRVILGGRPPVSNFFETILWLPFAAVILAIIFGRIYRATTYFGLAAAILAGLALTVSEYLPLDPSISPVVAVLRSNLWLTIHVLTIVASYGALALATVLAHIYGGFFLARRNHPALEPLDLFLYRTLQVGVVLLAAGIMLGAVWANASWGRYWGWDPKETWALITLLWFIAVLHGRMAGWLQGIRVAAAMIGGFLLVLMTYYGVSFYLVGLHSYSGGHAKPLPMLLIGYLAAEVAFLLALAGAARRRPSASS